MMPDRPLVVVGSGWLGSALAGRRTDAIHVAQRDFRSRLVPAEAAIIVASGASRLPNEAPASAVSSELADVTRVLETARKRDARVVVVGSSDVCGNAAVVDRLTPVDPVSAYGELKARREALVVSAAKSGLDATAIRLGPTHGPGKRQTARMLSLAKQRFVPLPRGGRYSVGFVTLPDAVEAILKATDADCGAIGAVGAGPTELRQLLVLLGGSASRGRVYPAAPIAVEMAQRLSRSSLGAAAWLGRFSLPRSVEMDIPVAPKTIHAACEYLLESAPARHA